MAGLKVAEDQMNTWSDGDPPHNSQNPRRSFSCLHLCRFVPLGAPNATTGVIWRGELVYID